MFTSYLVVCGGGEDPPVLLGVHLVNQAQHARTHARNLVGGQEVIHSQEAISPEL